MAVIDLHGAEVKRIARERPPVTVGPSAVIGLVGSAPESRQNAKASIVVGAGTSAFRLTADAVGAAGNDITVALVDPDANSRALAVALDGKAITVTLATSNTGAITTTAAQLVAAVNGNAAAAALVTAASVTTGAGRTAAAPAAPLAGGADAAFPEGRPELITTAARAAALGSSGGLAEAVRDVWRTAGPGGATIVAVRTADDSAGALAGDSGDKTGVHALLNAESLTGQRPRLIAAPGAQADAVTNALQAVAKALRGLAVTTVDEADAAAAASGGPDLSHVVACWPKLVVVEDGAEKVRPADALVLGHVARTDREFSFAASPSNRLMLGVLRTEKPVDWAVDSRTSAANVLNRGHVVTAVRRGAGVWLWGNRCSDGTLIPKRRADDIIADRLLDSVQDYIDRRVDLPFVEHVLGRLNAYIRNLVVAGHVRGGRAWFDGAHNSAEDLAASRVTFSFEITLHDIAEHIVVRSSVGEIPNDIIRQLTS